MVGKIFFVLPTFFLYLFGSLYVKLEFFMVN